MYGQVITLEYIAEKNIWSRNKTVSTSESVMENDQPV